MRWLFVPGPDNLRFISRQELTLANRLVRPRGSLRRRHVCSQSHKGIILVADDNEANRELLSALLSAEGYQVVCAADGQQARARVNSDSIDLALLDVVMPGRTGFEFVKR